MDSVLNILQRLICHKTQPTNQQFIAVKTDELSCMLQVSFLTDVAVYLFFLSPSEKWLGLALKNKYKLFYVK